MKVAVIIVTYNRLALLKECIGNALNQRDAYTELVIVNNYSTDGTYEYLQKIDDARIHCLHEHSNIGGAGGFHDGLAYANENTDCDWFLLIDDDAMLNEDYVLQIEKVFSNSCNAYAGAVYAEGRIDTRHRFRIEGGVVQANEYSKQLFTCDIATFCGLLVSRELVSKIGYPRKDFFIWQDDTEYCYRMQSETKIIVNPDAVVNHKTANLKYKDGNTIRDNWKLYYGFRNQLVIYKIYGKRKQYYSKTLRLIIRAVQYKMKGLVIRKNREDYLYNSKLRLDALIDMRHNKMGKNPQY